MFDPQRIHLDLVAAHFSTRCGASCAFCYFADALADRQPQTPFEDIERILTKLASDEVSEILFVGGDPVVHPRFIDSLGLAKSLGLRTSVLSNSWAIRPTARIDEAVALIDHCEATFLAATPDLHDSLTQRAGSFDLLLENLRPLVVSGKEIGVCVNATPGNVSCIYDIVARLRREHSIPIGNLLIQRIIPSGGVVGDFKFGLSLPDIAILMRQVDQVSSDLGIKVLFEDPVPWCTVEAKFHKYLARCEWGYTRGSVDGRGALNRCGADDRYRLGTIWDGHVQDIWRRHPILRSFRSKEYLPEECLSCSLLEQCGGGCSLSCGTLKDHGVDQLYVQRARTGGGATSFRAPSNSAVGGTTVRYACRGDLDVIVQLEREFFGPSAAVLTAATIETYFGRCPRAFRVATTAGQVVGYSVISPLTTRGAEEVRRLGLTSIIQIDPLMLAERFSTSNAALYLEVIACRAGAGPALRVGLLRDVVETMRRSGIPVLTCPISGVGLDLVTRCGFQPVGNGGVGALYESRPPGVSTRGARSHVSREGR
jgi:radical SAM protein with 4Fe4S-binding SPASM domain